jgi:glycosyltransferase involved in cell wall biosynthesis
MQGFVEKGYDTFLLTLSPKGQLHKIVDDFGVKAFGVSRNYKGVRFYIMNFIWLHKFCRENRISVIYSHLQNANLIALLTGYVLGVKVIPCRHHVDEVLLAGNKNGILIDKFVSFLSKRIVVVSDPIKRHMIEKERILSKKIVVIPLGYNFNLYNKPNQKEIVTIRDTYSCKLLLIIVSRMATNKRHIIAFRSVNRLVKKGLDIKLIVMDSGYEENNLRKFVSDNNLESNIFFTGFKDNIVDYISAADLLLCPSIIEASNQVVKEAAVLGKPSVVVKGVGDFDEYIVDKENGFFVSKDNTEDDMTNLLLKMYNSEYDLPFIGNSLKEIVYQKFAIEPVVEKYLQIALNKSS